MKSGWARIITTTRSGSCANMNTGGLRALLANLGWEVVGVDVGVDLIQDKVLLTGDYHYVARIMERGEGPFNIAMGLFTDLPKEGT